MTRLLSGWALPGRESTRWRAALGWWRRPAHHLGMLALALICAVSLPGRAESPEQLFAKALDSLERGANSEAIDRFELLADRGFVHPDASFDRAVAYVRRAQSGQAEPGDLGRAAAALEETRQLRPEDEAAEAALETVRAEIARRRARSGGEPVVVSPSLGRAVVMLLSEDVWAALALLGSLSLSVGLGLLLYTQRRTRRLTGAVAASVGGVLLLLCGSLALAARHFRVSTDPAVVVVPEARLLDAAGAPVKQKDGVPEHVAAPEGARVYVLEQKGRLLRVQWGTTEAWVNAGQLRILATPDG